MQPDPVLGQRQVAQMLREGCVLARGSSDATPLCSDKDTDGKAVLPAFDDRSDTLCNICDETPNKARTGGAYGMFLAKP